MLSAEEIKSLLRLEPLPGEGGFYAETFRSDKSIPKSVLRDYGGGSRAFATAIYYLLTADTFSAMHRLPTEEVFHFYLGDPVEMLQLSPGGTGRVVVLGSEIERGRLPQVVVPRKVWQGSRLVPGGNLALLGTTMSPGFEFADYEAGQRDVLLSSHPQFKDMIVALTREE